MQMELSDKLRLFKKKIDFVLPNQSNDNHQTIDAVLAGNYVETPFGTCFVTESSYPFSSYHGNSTLYPRFIEYVDILHTLGLTEFTGYTPFVFLDTETTGLSRGTGTYVFLVGIGRYSGESFVIRQYFLRDLPEECSLLFLVNEILSQGGVLVTYNGKCFDIPLLHTRFTCARMATEIQALPHLDLLHLSRRLWKERIGSCALSNVESQILGVKRSGDVPGALIPSLYFEYLESKDARPLQPVFYHNCQDILSLAALLNRLVWSMDIGRSRKANQELGDIYKAGRIYEDAGDLGAAEACYNLVIADECSKYQEQSSLWSLSMLMKRQKRLDEAVAIWERLLDHDIQVGIAPYIELAKFYEHKTKDYRTASDLVCKAMEILDKKSTLLKEKSNAYRQELIALRHRLNRLRRKQASIKDELEQ